MIQKQKEGLHCAIQANVQYKYPKLYFTQRHIETSFSLHSVFFLSLENLLYHSDPKRNYKWRAQLSTSLWIST